MAQKNNKNTPWLPSEDVAKKDFIRMSNDLVESYENKQRLITITAKDAFQLCESLATETLSYTENQKLIPGKTNQEDMFVSMMLSNDEQQILVKMQNKYGLDLIYFVTLTPVELVDLALITVNDVIHSAKSTAVLEYLNTKKQNSQLESLDSEEIEEITFSPEDKQFLIISRPQMEHSVNSNGPRERITSISVFDMMNAVNHVLNDQTKTSTFIAG